MNDDVSCQLWVVAVLKLLEKLRKLPGLEKLVQGIVERFIVPGILATTILQLEQTTSTQLSEHLLVHVAVEAVATRVDLPALVRVAVELEHDLLA